LLLRNYNAASGFDSTPEQMTTGKEYMMTLQGRLNITQQYTIYFFTCRCLFCICNHVCLYFRFCLWRYQCSQPCLQFWE